MIGSVTIVLDRTRILSIFQNILLKYQIQHKIHNIYQGKRPMGNSKSDMTCIIQTDKEFYFASDNVNGQLYIQTNKSVPCKRIILHIEGNENCTFQANDGTHVKGFKKLINTYYIVQQFNSNSYLDGQYEYPFSFRFLTYLPGSYNESKNYTANITYSMKAIIDTGKNDKKQYETTRQLIIREPQREGDKMLFGETFVNCRSCICFDKGISRVTCYFEKNFYLPEDNCIMICEADNTKCGLDITRIQCQLIKVLTLTAFNGTSREFKQSLNTVYFPGVRANQQYVGDKAERQQIKLIYKDSKKCIHPSTTGIHVRCEYFIIVKPIYSGCFIGLDQNEFKVKLNILQPAKEYEPIKQPQNWHPDVYRTSQIILNANIKNQLIDSMSEF